MGFCFQERPGLEICGRCYEVDLADVGFIEAVVSDFSGLIGEYETLAAMRGQLSVSEAAGLSPEAATELANRLTDCNRRLIFLARGFIEKTLGEEAYADIFAGRRPNSADHVELCTYIYEAAIKSREGVVSRYVLPDQPNRSARRAAKKPDSRSKKASD